MNDSVKIALIISCGLVASTLAYQICSMYEFFPTHNAEYLVGFKINKFSGNVWSIYGGKENFIESKDYPWLTSSWKDIIKAHASLLKELSPIFQLNDLFIPLLKSSLEKKYKGLGLDFESLGGHEISQDEYLNQTSTPGAIVTTKQLFNTSKSAIQTPGPIRKLN